MSRIVAVHPRENLLKVVVGHLLDLGDEMRRTTVIFPHRRPINFLEHYLRGRISKPLLLPRIRAFEDWVLETAVSLQKEPKEPLNELDQGWLCYQATVEVLQDEGKNAPSWDEFFPWAVQLARLFKEFHLELSQPSNLVSPPQELPSKAQGLLVRVGSIYQRFQELLEERNLTTPALLVKELAESEDLPEGPYLIVGFYALTKAEDLLFRRLFDQGKATVYWHSDPENLPEFHRRWKEQWGVEEVEPVAPQGKGEPQVHFFEAYDLHSELRELQRRFTEVPHDPDDTVVVLPTSKPLIPLLHHLPEGPVNVTMGYPLRMTGLFSFLESLFSVVETKDDSKGYRTKELLELLRCPYLRDTWWAERFLEGHGSPYITKEDLEDGVKGMAKGKAEKAGDSLHTLFEQVLRPLEESATPAGLAEAVQGILGSLELGVAEREIAAAVVSKALRPLKHSLFSQKEMKQRALFRLLLEMLRVINLPLEGEPLEGLQVMGLLETRTLSFKRIFVLEANEGTLPKVEETNPLMPLRARKLLGLSTRHREEAIVKHHFRRLLASAHEVHLFWQFQTTRAGESGLDGKKVRSRFVEELIWEMEKDQGEILEEGDGLISKAQLTVLPAFTYPKLLKKDVVSQDRILETLKEGKGVSPSLLNDYLECPLRFLYGKVLRLKPPQLPTDEPPADRLGTAVHEALKNYYQELSGGRLPAFVEKKRLNIDYLMKHLRDALEKQDFYQTLSPPRKSLLLEGAKFRLKEYLKNQHDTTVVALERECQREFVLDGGLSLPLYGKIDRVDERNGLSLVLDYKTGRIKNPSNSGILELSPADLPMDDAGLKVVWEHLPDLQLPFYVYLFCREGGCDFSSTTAAYVELRSTGEERFLVDPSQIKGSEWPQWMDTHFPDLLEYLLRHVLESPCWYPATYEGACQYCQYNATCRYRV